MYDMDKITSSKDNIYILWEYPLDRKAAFERLNFSLKTVCYFNKNKNIYLFSNVLTDEMISHINKGENNFHILRWSIDDLMLSTPFKDNYKNYIPDQVGWVSFSDIFRLAVIYRWGGTYVDVDNIAIKKLPDIDNILSRTLDPHSFDKKDTVLIPGKYREGQGKEKYNHIPFRFRNDPMVNFEAEHPFIKELIEMGIKENAPHNSSWQELMGELFLDHKENKKSQINSGLLLAYLPDGRGCYDYSDYDKCKYGGEMCDILFESCPDIQHVGDYKTDKREYAEKVLAEIYNRFPNVAFLWSQTHYKFKKGLFGKRKNKLSNWIVKIISEKIEQAG